MGNWKQYVWTVRRNQERKVRIRTLDILSVSLQDSLTAKLHISRCPADKAGEMNFQDKLRSKAGYVCSQRWYQNLFDDGDDGEDAEHIQTELNILHSDLS